MNAPQALGGKPFDIDDEGPLDELAKKFRVSRQAVEYRIRNLPAIDDSDSDGGYGVRFPRLTFPAAKPGRSSALSQFAVPQFHLERKGEQFTCIGLLTSKTNERDDAGSCCNGPLPGHFRTLTRLQKPLFRPCFCDSAAR
jgi:hypothetical protein